MPGKTYLITGANRGIGRSLFAHYASQSNNTVIAAVRNPTVSQALLSTTSKGLNTALHLVKIDSSSRTDPYDAITHLKAQGISHVDVVISCAGIAKLNTIEDIPLGEYEEVMMINSTSVMLLYKAALPLLREAEKSAKFVFISAAAGSLTDMEKYPYPNVSYAASKLVANLLVRKMGMENEGLITLMIHPGLVQTGLGNMGAKAFGLEEAPVTLQACVENTTHIIENATKEEHSGHFFNETLDRIHPW